MNVPQPFPFVFVMVFLFWSAKSYVAPASSCALNVPDSAVVSAFT